MLLLFIANAGLTVSEFAGIGASLEIFGSHATLRFRSHCSVSGTSASSASGAS